MLSSMIKALICAILLIVLYWCIEITYAMFFS